MVRSFTGFRPSPRYDAVPWNRVRIREAPVVDSEPGAFVTLETQVLAPVDADPERPQARNVTTGLATLDEAFYELVFLDAADNEDASDPVKFPSTGYPTPLELVAESSLDELTTLEFEAQEALWLSAKIAVEEFTGQTFDFEENLIVRLDGTGERRIFLPRRLDELTALTVSGSSLGASDVEISVKGDVLTVLASAGIGNYYERAMSTAWDDGPLRFVYGQGTVTITGDWGWREFPQAVRDAMRFDMEEQALADANALSATVQAVRRMGLNAIGQGGLRAQLVTPPTVSPRVAALLTPYAWHGTGGALA